MGVRPAVLTKGADRDTAGSYVWRITARAILTYSNGQTAIDDLGEITADLSPGATNPPQDAPTEHEWTPPYAPVQYDGSANMMEVRLELTGDILLDGEVVGRGKTILSAKYWADETDPSNPVAPTKPSIESLTVTPPAIGSENVGIELDADMDAAEFSWEVRAALDVVDESGDEVRQLSTFPATINGQLQPALGGVTDAPATYEWPSGYVRDDATPNSEIFATITAILRDSNGNNIDQVTQKTRWTSAQTLEP